MSDQAEWTIVDTNLDEPTRASSKTFETEEAAEEAIYRMVESAAKAHASLYYLQNLYPRKISDLEEPDQ